MKYYLDTEFNGFGGHLLSMGIIREDGRCFHAQLENINPEELNSWVRDNVYPYLNKIPEIGMSYRVGSNMFSYFLSEVFKGDSDIIVVTDWPDDIKYVCVNLITAPGFMINISSIKFEMIRVDSYPNDIEECVQHNAMWDAIALRYKLTGEKNYF